VKVGTSTLTDARGGIDRAYVLSLATQLAAQRSAGREAVLVTSGAIRAGMAALNAEGAAGGAALSTLPYRQAAAAVGQGHLMAFYIEALRWYDVVAAQVLLTRDDLADRRRYLNARNTFSALLALGVLPIVNENDTVAVDEIKFGDNDTLAARVASLIQADLLLVLSDVDGLYETAPRFGEPRPGVIRTVSRIDASIEAIAGGAGSDVGTGGMRTKIEAARIACASGVRTVIAHGRMPDVIRRAVEGEPVGTTFQAARARPLGRKRWILAGSRVRGAVVVNAQAEERLRRFGASLLPVGVVGVEGAFEAGDLVEVRCADGRRFARGVTSYSADELRRVQGRRSEEFEAILGYRGYDEAIHRDNLVIDA
jgi:glutamate 5-kinase